MKNQHHNPSKYTVSKLTTFRGKKKKQTPQKKQAEFLPNTSGLPTL